MLSIDVPQTIVANYRSMVPLVKDSEPSRVKVLGLVTTPAQGLLRIAPRRGAPIQVATHPEPQAGSIRHGTDRVAVSGAPPDPRR